MKRLIFLAIVLIGLLVFFLSKPDPKDHVVMLLGKGQCTGVQVKYNNKYYILTAAHCTPYKGFFEVRQNKKVYRVPVLFEDVASDLLVLENPFKKGVVIADYWNPGEKVYSLTHGSGMPLHRTDGEFLNLMFIDIPIGPASKCKLDQVKFSIQKITFFIIEQKVCMMSTWLISSTVKVTPGSSGGPIFDNSNELVAIVSAADNNGFSFLVPLEDIIRVLEGVENGRN